MTHLQSMQSENMRAAPGAGGAIQPDGLEVADHVRLRDVDLHHGAVSQLHCGDSFAAQQPPQWQGGGGTVAVAVVRSDMQVPGQMQANYGGSLRLQCRVSGAGHPAVVAGACGPQGKALS